MIRIEDILYGIALEFKKITLTKHKLSQGNQKSQNTVTNKQSKKQSKESNTEYQPVTILLTERKFRATGVAT